MKTTILTLLLLAFSDPLIPGPPNPTPDPRPLKPALTPDPPKPIAAPVNPLEPLLKKGKAVYRLDDRVSGKLQCDKWTFTPDTTDKTKGTLTFQYALSDRKVAYTYGYQSTLNAQSAWLLSMTAQKRIETLSGGVQFQQEVICQEEFEVGARRKTELDIGGGLWYLTKSACDAALKKKADKSPGSC